MTRYELFRKKSLPELAHDLCDLVDECEFCPATDLCVKGRNGFFPYLEQEVDEDGNALQSDK